jgi:GNAT superfamily N-acetyltransferase
MVEIVTFREEQHRTAWEAFVATSYRNPNYVLLSPAFLRWQFLDNPANATGGYTLWLVTHRDEIVAQLGCVPFAGQTPAGEPFTGAYPINLIVRPDYRAAGLGAVLLKRLLQEVPCVLNPGSSEAGATLCMGLGMRDMGLLRRYIAILDAGAARGLAADGRLPSGVGDVARSEARTGSAAIVAATRLPDAAPDCFAFPIPAYGAGRSRAFFRWRYENHPAFKYEFLLSEDLQSVLVFHEEREKSTGILVIRIVDLLADRTARDPLLQAAVRTARARGAVLADFFCSTACYDEALKRAGFFDEAQHGDGRIAALFQPLDFRKVGIRTLVSYRPEPLSLEAQWYVSKADSDQDRPNDRRDIAAGDRRLPPSTSP